MFTVRAQNGPTSFSFSRGEYDPARGYCIKYKTEFNDYMYYKNIIKTPEDWKKIKPVKATNCQMSNVTVFTLKHFGFWGEII